jgi:putative ABC transport system permease protein
MDITSVGSDLRQALRSLRRNPGLTLVVLAVVALGIGANTATLSIVHTVLARPLSYENPERLAVVWEKRQAPGGNLADGHEYTEWQARNQVFERLGAATLSGSALNLTGQGEPLAVVGARVSASFFEVMGVPPLLGRTFLSEEDAPGRGGVAVLGHRLWKNRFGGDPAIVGRPIMLSDRSYTVVGVMPADFQLPRVMRLPADADLWTPIAEPIHLYGGRHFLLVVGRLKPGISLIQAQTDMDAVARQIADEDPAANDHHEVRVASLHEAIVADARPPLLVMSWAVGLVLLVGCANVAGLLLARAAARRKEMAVRTAIGASRVRLIRLLLCESLLLSLMGGALGFWVSAELLAWLPTLSGLDLPRLGEVGVDARVLWSTAGLSVLTGLLFGLTPAVQGSRLHPGEELKEGARCSSGRDRQRARRVLVVGEIALTVLLVAGAMLLLRSFLALSRVETGFQPERLLTFDLGLPAARYPKTTEITGFYQRLFEAVRAVPGVEAVGATTTLPLSGSQSTVGLGIEGRPESRPGEGPRAGFRVVTLGYFHAMGVPLERGRDFEERDARRAVPLVRWYPEQPHPPRFAESQARPVAIVNEAMARTFWPGEDPLGKRISVVLSPWVEVIGVVGDVRHEGLAMEAGPEMYLLDLQEPQRQLSVMVRASGDPARLAGAIQRTVRALDSDLPIQRLRPMGQLVAANVAQPRFLSGLVGAFAAMALLSTVVGLGGLVSYSVGQRTREIGVRVALGARPVDVLRLVVGQGMALAFVGGILGLAGAFTFSRLLEKLIFGVTPTDPLTFALVVLLLLLAVFGACYLPARRALRLEPTQCLRQE